MGGLILIHDIDTTKGQSGSAILAKDSANPSQNGKVCIGIHTGGHKKSQLNVGTLFTKGIDFWIKVCVDNMIAKQEKE